MEVEEVEVVVVVAAAEAEEEASPVRARGGAHGMLVACSTPMAETTKSTPYTLHSDSGTTSSSDAHGGDWSDCGLGPQRPRPLSTPRHRDGWLSRLACTPNACCMRAGRARVSSNLLGSNW
jgi:hypothetical protein